jgi:hypothetical protein
VNDISFASLLIVKLSSSLLALRSISKSFSLGNANEVSRLTMASSLSKRKSESYLTPLNLAIFVSDSLASSYLYLL